MKIALDLDVQLKDGILILKESSGRTLIFPKDHVVPKKIQMVTLERVIQLRLSTDKNMYEMTPILNREGFSVKARLVAQILSDYGISKKNR
jgi:hypothetical protein